MSGRSRAAIRWGIRASCASALAATLAGCGGSSNALGRGHAIFTQRCSSCHTLTGRDTHADGGDLAVAHLSVADIASFARVMPLRPSLSRRDTLAVAEYVHARASKR